MINWIQKGDTITVPAPTGGFTSGTGYLTGSMFGVATTTQLAAVATELQITGVVSLPKATGASWAIGDLVYWDNGAHNVTKTSSSNTKIGVAVSVQASGDTAGSVRLNGAF